MSCKFASSLSSWCEKQKRNKFPIPPCENNLGRICFTLKVWRSCLKREWRLLNGPWTPKKPTAACFFLKHMGHLVTWNFNDVTKYSWVSVRCICFLHCEGCWVVFFVGDAWESEYSWSRIRRVKERLELGGVDPKTIQIPWVSTWNQAFRTTFFDKMPDGSPTAVYSFQKKMFVDFSHMVS